MSAEDRYAAAMHAVQTGVAYEMEMGSKASSPKNLRVGVNAAMCEHAALVRLLMEKGLLSDAEYKEAIADEAEREKARYEERNGIRFA